VTPTEQPAGPPPARKSRTGLKIAIVLLLVLGTGGGAAGWWWMRSRPAPQVPHAPVPEETSILTLEPFLVNLADSQAASYLRISLGLVIAGDEEHTKVLEADRVRVLRARSTIIELLTVQTSEQLNTPEGKTALKQAIARRAAEALKPAEVRDVLFSDFVVQY
jgi:flagellar protein FliL